MTKKIVFLQARINSNRLPNKVLLLINGEPMIIRQISRINKSKKIDELIALIPDTKENDPLFDYLSKKKIKTFRGDLSNVFDRFLRASVAYPSDVIIRLTADCPLFMPDLLDAMLDKFQSYDIDYLSNGIEETFPDGLDIEIFKSDVLPKLAKMNLSAQEKEHVTLGIYRRPHLFSIQNYKSSTNMANFRWTVDYLEDFQFVKKVFTHFLGKEDTFNIEDLLNYIAINPEKNDNKTPNNLRNIALKIEDSIE